MQQAQTYLDNVRGEVKNDRDDEHQANKEDILLESQIKVRQKKDNVIQNFEIQEQRLRQKFLTNIADERDRQALFH